jgi:lysozyme family protein
LLPAPLPVVIFDGAVNCGANSARIWLQKAIADTGRKIVVDGVVGPITLAAVRTCNPYNLSCKVIAHRMLRYIRIIKNNPTQKVFIGGWMNRAASLSRYI